jgi:sulfite exporter TauE/SafE/copper chaperone CopZ
MKQEFWVEGMHCAACELLIEKKLGAVPGVEKVDAKLGEKKVYIDADHILESEELSILVEKHGYKIVDGITSSKANWRDLGIAAIIASVIVGLFLLIQKLGIVDFLNADQITLPFVFFVGVIASLSTCMAVVGGLVLSISSNYAMGNKVKPLLAFHISRIIGFFVLGGLIGLIGSAFVLTSAISFVLNIILFIVMLIMGINLLNIFPWAAKLQLKLPKSVGKRVLKLEDRSGLLTPVLLGMATFVLPCGFTQSMQIHSLTTGSFVTGAITMLVFALGTFPVLALISFASVKLSKTLQSGIFFKTAGLIVLFFAVFNFAAALAAIGLIPPLF